MARKLPELDELTAAANTPVTLLTAAPTTAPRRSKAGRGPNKIPLMVRLAPDVHHWLVEQAAATSIRESRNVTVQEIISSILSAAQQQHKGGV
ncbi:MAG: hypothetical protein U1F76_28870 [Candidatus Competibacteraceae bacterium]